MLETNQTIPAKQKKSHLSIEKHKLKKRIKIFRSIRKDLRNTVIIDIVEILNKNQ